jgi:hypothetical protein
MERSLRRIMVLFLLIIGCFVCVPPFRILIERSFYNILWSPIRSRNFANTNNPPRDVMFRLSNLRETLENRLSVFLKRCIILFTFQVASFPCVLQNRYYINGCLESIYFNIYLFFFSFSAESG